VRCLTLVHGRWATRALAGHSVLVPGDVCRKLCETTTCAGACKWLFFLAFFGLGPGSDWLIELPSLPSHRYLVDNRSVVDVEKDPSNVQGGHCRSDSVDSKTRHCVPDYWQIAPSL